MTAPVPVDDDPIVRALGVLNSRGAFLVMREAFYGTRRFDDFARRLSMSPSSLAARLRTLVDAGLLSRVPYQEAGTRTRQEYAVTAKGEALLPALVALLRWGNDHLPPRGAGVELVHAACTTPVHAELRCARGDEVPLRELRAVPTSPHPRMSATMNRIGDQDADPVHPRVHP
jgi:DNA-binding HxlR family transcriptional regulator